VSNRNTFLKCWYIKIVLHLGILWCDSSVACNCLSSRNKINSRKCVRASLLHLRVGYMDGWVNDVTTSIKTALTLMSLSFNNPPTLHPSFPCSSFCTTSYPPTPDSHISCPGNIHAESRRDCQLFLRAELSLHFLWVCNTRKENLLIGSKSLYSSVLCWS